MANKKTTRFKYKTVVGRGYFLGMVDEDIEEDSSEGRMAVHCLKSLTEFCSELLKGGKCEIKIEENALVLYHNRRLTMKDVRDGAAYWRGMRDVWGWI